MFVIVIIFSIEPFFLKKKKIYIFFRKKGYIKHYNFRFICVYIGKIFIVSIW
jgi:hypothetical protein